MDSALNMLVLPLLVGALLAFGSVLEGLFSARAGFSFLLVFLLAGILAGEDGPGGIRFDDINLSFWVGNVALAVILMDGGLRTEFRTFRTGLKPALLLASAGVVLSAAITAAGARWLLDISWPLALLLGSIVGSTDAAAVFALLKSSGVRLNERVAATLEIESGMNDPMAVYLTISFIGVALAAGAVGGAGANIDWADATTTLLLQFGLGGAGGVLAGWLLAALLVRTRERFDAREQARTGPGAASGGVLALLVLSFGLAVFALLSWAGGSGFLAVYVMGVLARNRSRGAIAPALSALDGYAWLGQAGMFLLLGLLLTPRELLPHLGPALGVAAVLMLLARPLAVALCLRPFHFEPREVAFVAWVGLRGAVPIVLAVFPMIAGVPGARLLFNVAFVVVLVSLLLQGSTIAWAARRLGVNLPAADDVPGQRAVFGDFALEGSTPLADVCAFYGLPEPEHADWPLERWIGHAVQRPPVVGDRVALGGAELSVRAMNGARVLIVGLRLPSQPPD